MRRPKSGAGKTVTRGSYFSCHGFIVAVFVCDKKCRAIP
jgi:hypothetical protein